MGHHKIRHCIWSSCSVRNFPCSSVHRFFCNGLWCLVKFRLTFVPHCGWHWWRRVHLSEKSRSLLSVAADAEHDHLKPGFDIFTLRLSLQLVHTPTTRLDTLEWHRTVQPSNLLCNSLTTSTTAGAREHTDKVWYFFLYQTVCTHQARVPHFTFLLGVLDFFFRGTRLCSLLQSTYISVSSKLLFLWTCDDGGHISLQSWKVHHIFHYSTIIKQFNNT